MATIINADTSNGLKLTSDTSGEIELQSAGTTIATVDSTGIAMASGKLLASTGPAFRASLSADQSITSGTQTKVQFDLETFDTTSDYDNSTNYRFTPSVEGYYQVNVSVRSEGTSLTLFGVYIFKNGSNYLLASLDTTGSSTTHLSSSALIYMNGTTDYLEIYGRIDGTSPRFGGSSTGTNADFSSFLARAA